MLRSVAASTVAALGLALAFGVAGVNRAEAASTYTYGVPVKSLTNSTKVGDVDPDHTINFYIPLDGGSDNNDTYGKNGEGLHADTCNERDGCEKGQLTMYIRYAPVTPIAGPAVITFDFTDLDLKGVNDPFGFFESVEFYYKDKSLGKVDEKTDIQVQSANVNRQLIQIVVGEVLSPFTVKLVLKTSGDIKKGMVNTEEKLKTYIKQPLAPVPLPAALPLFGTGLAAIGMLRWRRSRTGRTATSA